MGEYLSQLAVIAGSADVYERVVKAIDQLRSDSSATSNINDVINANDPQARLVKLGVIICLWLEEYARSKGNKVLSTKIIDALGLRQAGQVHSILDGAGIHLPLGLFLQRLDAQPLRLPSMFNCGVRYWDERIRGASSLRPKCLNQPSE